MARAYIYDMVDVWASAPTTFRAIKMNVTDTASAAGSLLMDLQVGGVSQFSVRKDGATTITTKLAGGGFTLGENGSGAITVRATGLYGWESGTTGGGVYDLVLARDAANTLAQRNGVNAQTLRVYNTFTDASNNIYLNVRWSATDARIQTSNNGSGTSTPSTLTFGSNGTESWRINTSNHFVAVTDNTYDIGASGANRPRNVYVGTLVQSLVLEATATGYIGWDTRSRIRSPSDGVLLLRNNAETDFGRLCFGGTSSSFPSLARNGAGIQCRLADNSSLANFECAALDSTVGNVRAGGAIIANFATAIPAGGTAGAGLRVSSTSNFGVFFGSGAPTLSAAKGSLYLRSDGSTTNDRMYVNTDGATTWTAVTTAA